MCPAIAAASSAQDDTRDPFSDGPVGQVAREVGELLRLARETARGMLDAEDALDLLHERFERTEDRGERGKLAAEALDQIERQMAFAREGRRRLDGIEGKLWARRNRLERFLIHARGLDWWHARRDTGRKRLASDPGSSGEEMHTGR